MVSALEHCSRTESSNTSNVNSTGDGSLPVPVDHNPCSCAYLSSLLIYFVLFQLISFPSLVLRLHAKVIVCFYRNVFLFKESFIMPKGNLYLVYFHIYFSQLKGKTSHQGRDHLMWVLLQFLSGSIQKNQFSDFLPVLRLIGE